MLALGVWGISVPMPAAPTTLSATSILLFLRSRVRPDPTVPPIICRLELDDRVWTVQIEAGQVQIQSDEPIAPDACLRTTPATLNTLLNNPMALDAALADGTISATGDLAALHQLFGMITTIEQR